MRQSILSIIDQQGDKSIDYNSLTTEELWDRFINQFTESSESEFLNQEVNGNLAQTDSINEMDVVQNEVQHDERIPNELQPNQNLSEIDIWKNIAKVYSLNTRSDEGNENVVIIVIINV